MSVADDRRTYWLKNPKADNGGYGKLRKAVCHKNLSLRQIKFTENYLNNGMVKPVEAAIAAGYSPKSARCMAYKLLKSPSINHYMKSRVERVAAPLVATFDHTIKKLWNVVEAGISDHVEQVKIADPKRIALGLQASAELSKMQGHYSAEKHTNVNINLDSDIETTKKVMDEMLEKYKREY